VHHDTCSDKLRWRKEQVNWNPQNFCCAVHLIEEDTLLPTLNIAHSCARDTERLRKSSLLPSLLAADALQLLTKCLTDPAREGSADGTSGREFDILFLGHTKKGSVKSIACQVQLCMLRT
jgi:hypothetical protein